MEQIVENDLEYGRFEMKEDEIRTRISDAEAKGKADVAKSLLNNNVDINIIAASTGLSIDDIEKLK